MSGIETILAAFFWCSAAAVAYAYLGYPAVLWALSPVFGKDRAVREVPDADLPGVALLIVAHNEAEVIEQRLRNALACEYPRDRFKVVVASDGSDDGTVEICRRFEDRITPLMFPIRRGKPATLNAALEHLDADIVVLSDANTSMDKDAVRLLARRFADPRVGAVCGRLILSDRPGSGNADGIYWRYETFLKRCEGRLNGLLGANGGLYAIRRSLMKPLPAGTVVDDFVIPLMAKLESGCRLEYEPLAVAHEETAPNLGGEFRRRARIGNGGFQALGVLWPLLSPRYGWTAFTFWSHKVLRWICPFFLIGALLACGVLAANPLFRMMLAAQVAFYVIAAGACLLPPRNAACRLLRVSSFFTSMNLALLVGFMRWLRGRQAAVWNRTERPRDCGSTA